MTNAKKLSKTQIEALRALQAEERFGSGYRVIMSYADGSGSAFVNESKTTIARRTLLALVRAGLVTMTTVDSGREYSRGSRGSKLHFWHNSAVSLTDAGRAFSTENAS